MPADRNVICITAMSEHPSQMQAIEHSKLSKKIPAKYSFPYELRGKCNLWI